MAMPDHSKGVKADNDNNGVKVIRVCTVNAPAEKLYNYWRHFENLPHCMPGLVSVFPTTETESHWVVKGPSNKKVEWDAVIINEHPNELIAWRTKEGSEIGHAGSVRFEKAPAGRGTEVRVTMEYYPATGKTGAFLAKLLGREPGQQVEQGLRNFKALMEVGEIPTTEGQPHGK